MGYLSVYQANKLRNKYIRKHKILDKSNDSNFIRTNTNLLLFTNFHDLDMGNIGLFHYLQ